MSTKMISDPDAVKPAFKLVDATIAKSGDDWQVFRLTHGSIGEVEITVEKVSAETSTVAAIERLKERIARLEGGLRIALQDLDEGYAATRAFIDANVPGWTRGDDGPSRPCIRNRRKLVAALEGKPTEEGEGDAL